MLLALALLMMLADPASPPASPALFDPATGYRVAQYRGVVPVPPPGIARIDDAEAAALHDGGKALFLDVTPAGGHRDADTGLWHLAEAHVTIPGAHWFPEAGRGPADSVIDAWFAHGVARLARGSKRRPIVAFCLADCWMSWNASLKLHRLGYRNVRWYANGADGWRDLDRTLVDVEPER